MNTSDWMSELLEDNVEKYQSELDWHQRAYSDRGGKTSNSWYERHFTKLVGIDKSFYDGKRVVDIGCGPLGTLEWADNAKIRVGIDPLANGYFDIGTDDQDMTYVVARAEQIPFPTGYFDIAISFNNIDHVDDLDATISEIKRIVRVGGIFILMTDLHEKPTVNEPQMITWDILSDFEPEFEIQRTWKLEKTVPTNGYQSVENEVPYDFSDTEPRYGIIKAVMKRT